MLIDWFTVAAQILNFAILVWLMKRVLYKPVMAAIEAREALVAAELTNAAVKSQSADQAVESFRHKNEAFDRDRAALLAKATQEAKAQASHLLESARAQADALQSRRRDALDREERDFKAGLSHRAQQAFFSLARRAFKDLADSSLEGQVVARFCERLRGLHHKDTGILDAAVKASDMPVLIRVAFALSSELQRGLQAAVDETFGRQILLRYEIAPELISGIELTAQGQRITWSIADYLATLEQEVASGPGTALALKATLPAVDATASAPAALLVATR